MAASTPALIRNGFRRFQRGGSGGREDSPSAVSSPRSSQTAPQRYDAKQIARLNSDGSLDTGFDPNANNTVNGLAVQADGKILLVGSFDTVGGTTRNNIARLNSDGTLDTAFDPNANGEVKSVAVQADGKILLGGFFNNVGGTARNNIARLNSNGSFDTGFDPNANSVVSSVAVQADGKILLGGSFTTLQPNGAPSATTRNSIARLNSDGSLDTGFDPNADSDVYSVAVQADGEILIGGHFITLQPNGAASPRRAERLRGSTATAASTLPLIPNADSDVFSVAVQADGKILLGGFFTSLQPNGAPSPTTRNKMARLNNDNAFQSLSAPDATRVQWLRGGAAPEVEQVTFELSTNAGSTWTPLGSGTRIAGGWELTGLSLPASGSLRASGRASSGFQNGSSGFIQQVGDFGPAGGPDAIYNPSVAGANGNTYVLCHGGAAGREDDRRGQFHHGGRRGPCQHRAAQCRWDGGRELHGEHE